MRILRIDERKNFLRLVPEISDDLWHLERVIEKGDLVSGSTDRKIKPRAEGEKPHRVKLFVSLETDAVEFHRFSGKLRISGKIVEGKPAELLEKGAQQSLDVELGQPIKVQKRNLLRFQVERLRKASAATLKGRVLLVVLDDEQADFALLREFELQEKGRVGSGKSGKRFGTEDESVKKKYFAAVLEKIREADAERVVVAGPGFTKSDFGRFLEEKGKPGKTQFFFAATNSVGKTGLQELLKGNALDKMMREMQLVRETQMIEAILAELGKNSGLVEYGLQQVRKAVEFGAVQQLLVADETLLHNRAEVEQLMQKAEQMHGEVHLVNSEHEAGKKLVSLGGIAALLRYRIG